MHETLRTIVAGAAGAILATAVIAGTPAVADGLDKAVAKNSVTSKSIKNGTIKKKDLSSEVTGPLAKADTALQSVPDNGVTTPKLADNAVTNPKVADNAIGSAEIAANSIANGDIAANAITGNKVDDGSLSAVDVASARGVTSINFGNIPALGCLSTNINTSNVLDNDLLMITPGALLGTSVQVDARQDSPGSTNMTVIACSNAGAVDPPAVNFSWAVLEN